MISLALQREALLNERRKEHASDRFNVTGTSSYYACIEESLTTTLSNTRTSLHALLGDLRNVGSSRLGSLGGLLLLLIALRLGDGGLTGSSSDFGLGGTLGEDRGEVSSDDSTLISDSLGTSPTWTLTFFLLLFLATSSVIPFLCILQSARIPCRILSPTHLR